MEKPATEPGLSAKQARFVHEYLIDLNATQAAIRAGYSAKGAQVQGFRLLTNVKIGAAIKQAMEERSERTKIDVDFVLRQWVEIATADPNELIQYRRSCCPECWGEEFAGQRDARPDCLRCKGEGSGQVFVADTRKLKGAARRLYAGVKETKEGIQVVMRDQDAALANIARHLGMFPSKVELTGKDGGPVEVANLTDEQIEAKLAVLLEKANG